MLIILIDSIVLSKTGVNSTMLCSKTQRNCLNDAYLHHLKHYKKNLLFSGHVDHNEYIEFKIFCGY